MMLSRSVVMGAVVLLAACAGYSGSNLKPGLSTLPEVVASMGEPALRWKDPDGGEQLAYPRGPAGTQTFMAVSYTQLDLNKRQWVLSRATIKRSKPASC